MAEHENNKTRLHKEVSSIFKGVPLPQNDDAQQPSGAPAPQSADSAPIGPVSPEDQKPNVSLFQKLQQPAQFSQKDAPTEQLRIEPAVITTETSLWQRIKDKLFTPKPGVSTTRQKATVALVPVLGIVFVLVLRQVIGTAPRETKGAVIHNATSVVTATDSDNTIHWQIPEPYPATLRDPMRPGSAITTQTGTEKPITRKMGRPTLRSIVYSENNPSAVIGSHIVHEGEEISGATVVKINRDSVEFKMDGLTWKQKIRE